MGNRWAVITPMFAGHGGETWTFRADCSDAAYFLKFKSGIYEPGVSVSRALAQKYIPAIAPLLSLAGGEWKQVSELQLLVYPLIDAGPVVQAKMTDADCSTLGRALRSVYDATLPEAFHWKNMEDDKEST